MKRICLVALLASGICSAVFADSIIDFDDGLLPSDLGWMYDSQCLPNFPTGINLPESVAASVGGGVLNLDTTVPVTTFVNAFYSLFDSVDPSLDLLFEARVRVLEVESPPPSTAQAFAMTIIFNNFFYILQVTEDDVRTFDPPAPGVAIDTGEFHTYSIFLPAGQQQYSVLLDGVPVLQEDRDPTALFFNRINFGNSTCQSRNGNVEIDYVRFIQFPEDSDGDGIPDSDDLCSDTNLSETVVIDECDSFVPNNLNDDGCTVMDLIEQCLIDAGNHGQFVACVAQLTSGLKTEGIIGGREKGGIQRCAARANLP